MKFTLLALLFVLLACADLRANNLNISAVTVTNGGATLDFTISWDNSWRVLAQPANHDAVWLIVKRRDCASIDYRHQDVSNTLGDHSFGVPLTATTTTDRKGLFIHRATPGQGNIVSVPVRIALHNPPAGEYDYKVVGIEMVYVPEGAFYIGDGSPVGDWAFSASPASSRTPFYITSENPIAVVTAATAGGSLTSTGFINGFSTNIPLSYPKGFNAFYAMKYEISLGQFLDFLNSAPAAAGNPARHGYTTPTGGPGGRNPVTGNYPFYTTTTPNRACDSLSWAGLLAYLDWAALAPMSEFEFEKLCRGTFGFVMDEYASSSDAIEDVNALINDGTATESVGAPFNSPVNVGSDGNHLGAYRVGFAATATTTLRIETGGSYYGAMELSGNVAERAVGVILDGNTNTHMTAFNGAVHGDGEIAGTGFSNQGWPSQSTIALVDSFGTIRGGAWNMVAARAQVSDRLLTRHTERGSLGYIGRRNGLGGRGARRAVSGTSTF